MLSLLAQSSWIPKSQQVDLHHLLGQEAATVDFGGILRFMKALQGMLGDESFEECLDNLLEGVETWRGDDRAKQAPGEPSSPEAPGETPTRLDSTSSLQGAPKLRSNLRRAL